MPMRNSEESLKHTHRHTHIHILTDIRTDAQISPATQTDAMIHLNKNNRIHSKYTLINPTHNTTTHSNHDLAYPQYYYSQ